MLLDGRADVALLRGPLFNPLLDSEVLLTEPRMAVLPAGHRLARRERLRRIDLEGEPVLHWADATAEQAAYNAATDTWTTTTHAVHAPPGPRVDEFHCERGGRGPGVTCAEHAGAASWPSGQKSSWTTAPAVSGPNSCRSSRHSWPAKTLRHARFSPCGSRWSPLPTQAPCKWITNRLWRPSLPTPSTIG
ncbi:LysR family transcriptional regulator substrate-binding protein [Streptomyces sasae]|uniref:LysR family transcriptional regulator substrate-binding protein n=1 Tax=Streptomyces sasae TaxID=1266772 RepID=UPI003744A434